MNSGSLDDLVPEPIQHLSGDDDLLSDLKFDPLSEAMSDQLADTDGESAETGTHSNDGFFQPASSPSEDSDLSTDFPVDPKSDSMVSIEDATPIRDPDDVTPIILKAINRGDGSSPPSSPHQPSQEFVVDDLPMLPVSQPLVPTKIAPERPAGVAASVDTATNAKEHLEPVTLPEPDHNNGISEPLTPATAQSARLSPVSAQASESDHGVKNESTNQLDNSLVTGAANLPSKVDFDEFVSDQMEFRLPPFAMHPDDNTMHVDDGFFEAQTIDSEPVESTAIESESTEPESTKNEFVANRDFATESLQVMNNHTTVPTESDKSNFFVGNRIETDDVPTELPPFEAQSAELPAEPMAVEVSGPKADFVTAPASESATTEKINWQGQLDRTITVFEDQIHETEDDIEADNLESGLAILKALRLRMQPDDNSPEEIRKYWTHQIQAINDLLNNSSGQSDSRVAALALEELRLAVHNLQVIADLKIFNAVICKSVSGYGQYEPFESKEFVARQTILVYCEIDNFAPLLETTNGRTSYQTRLSSSFTIRSLDGDVVQHQDFPVVTDSARNLRRDFFMHLPITFGDLERGVYELQITVRDHGSDKTAELDRSLKLTIR